MLKFGEEELKNYIIDVIYSVLYGIYLWKLMLGFEEVCEYIILK